MKTFALTRASDSGQAIATAAKATTAQQGAEIRFIGGGTTLIDLMKLNVEQPETLIDINRLPLDKIEALPDGGLTIGAVVRNSDLAYHPLVQKKLRRFIRSDFERRVGAAFGTWRPPPAICCSGTRCMYFSRYRDAVQQARAGVGLRGDHGSKPQSGHSRHKRTLCCDEPVRHVCGHGRA